MFLGPPLNFAPPQIYVFAQVPHNYFGLNVLGPPLKLGVGGGGGGGGLLPWFSNKLFSCTILHSKRIVFTPKKVQVKYFNKN